MIEAFIFDLDGVITDTAYYHYMAWRKLAHKVGIDIDTKFNESLKGISRMESLDRILEFGNKKYSFSEEEKVRMAEEKNNYYVSLIDEITSNDILPGIESLLIDVKSNNIKIGLSSASKNAINVLNHLGISDKFDFIADVGKCKNNKPHPEIFLMSAKGLNVNPQNCIGIEDASAGIDAINSANMFSVGVGNYENLKKANLVVDSTNQLKFEYIQEKYNEYIVRRII
ncbi:beta-phosphoglucomutase [Clostridioides difficile]|nr:beta-phosphoglucomutase [Clostridioides difficile]MDM9771753.1 beta-phosphoglucomutase [Clostridioides difficile]HBF8526339.1 beta-phosphoglucomutase [Clostridioides difficile]